MQFWNLDGRSKLLRVVRWRLCLVALVCTLGCTGGEQSAAQSNNTARSGGAIGGATLAGLAQPLKQGSDWASFLGPNGDGTSSELGIDPAAWQPHPKLLWTMKLGVSYGAPSIVGDRMLQFDRFGVQERLTCFDVKTARELWRAEERVDYDDMYGYNNGPRCSPIVSDGLVFTYGVAGNLSCVELETGKKLWSKDTLKEYQVIQNFFGVASCPFVFEDKLLVMVGGSPPEARAAPNGRLDLVKPNGSAIVAFDKRNGKELYRVGNDLASYSSVTVRTIDGRPTGLALCRDGLLAWDASTGEQLFHFPWRAAMLESVNAAMPVVRGSEVFISEAYEIGSVLVDTSQMVDGLPAVVWKDEGPRNRCSFRAHWSTPVLLDGFLYGSNGRNQPDSDFRCVDFETGEVKWADRRHERSSVLLIDGYLIVLGEYGKLELIRPSPDKLDVVAECELGDIQAPGENRPLLTFPCWAAPVVSHGLLYLRGNDHLACFQLFAPEPDE